MTDRYRIINADCLDAMRDMPDASVDAVVTDPPYGLSFMGKGWDHSVPGPEFYREMLRVAKPGAHLLSFCGTRTFHRMWCAIEDAGWEIRDTLSWLYGSGFPKSLDVSKAMDKAAGTNVSSDERWVPTPHPVTGAYKTASGNSQQVGQAKPGLRCLYDPATDLARQWHGWGTALKPAWEPICLARKPLSGTVAATVAEHGTGALNIDGCRIGTEQTVTVRNGDSGGNGAYGRDTRVFSRINPPGRWPANLALDGSDEVVGLFPQTAASKSGGKAGWQDQYVGGTYKPVDRTGYDEAPGSASRFFYCAKASRADREAGLDGFEAIQCQGGMGGSMPVDDNGKDRDRFKTTARNHHPTVKPTDLMRWLCRLVTPPGGLVLDPFAGSGSTGKAAILEGFRFVGIEREAEYCEIAHARIEHAAKEAGLFA